MATVTVEVHPASAIMPLEFKRWRVMIDGKQNSVHETPEEAEEAAVAARKEIAGAWTPARGHESRTGSAKSDWRK